MKLWEIIVAAIVIFLVWGRVSKKVVPKSCIRTTRPITPLVSGCSSGDNFTGGKTTVLGVPEPVISCDARSLNPLSAPHVFFPVNPQLSTAPPIPIFNAPAPAQRSTRPLYLSQLAAGEAKMAANIGRSSPGVPGSCGTPCYCGAFNV